MERTLTRELKDEVGKSVLLQGWIHGRRDHGKLVFLDLRDRTGLAQIVVTPKSSAAGVAHQLRAEYVVAIRGTVNARPENMVNPDLPSGTVEVVAEEITILTCADTPPFELDDTRSVGEDLRMQYRYLDLRTERMARHIRNRHRAIQFIRNFLVEQDFVEVETPMLTRSTPEGARDFVVPSRLHPGTFYALPQSPQQYKQLLMVAGMERYFQIARCLRDEDTRGDRQVEHTQLDLEMSFVQQDDILVLIEELYTALVKKLYPDKRVTKTPWPRLTYDEVMAEYGTDRPDLRENTDDPDELAFVWIFNFPLFEPDKENGHFAPSHHMFTAPKEADIPKLKTDPAAVRSYQHDLSLNGNEIAGGSIRIHDPELQQQIFDLIGFTDQHKAQFRHLLEAFRYGVPPHGGIASGLDRFLMILENEPNIREVIAFPKTGDGRDLLMNTPSQLLPEQLAELPWLKISQPKGK